MTRLFVIRFDKRKNLFDKETMLGRLIYEHIQSTNLYLLVYKTLHVAHISACILRLQNVSINNLYLNKIF